MPLLVIYNPVCGDGSAKVFFEEIVLPLLKKHGKIVDITVVTEGPGHGGTAVLDFLQSTGGDTVVVLGSGDGTLHEIINALCNAELKGSTKHSPLRFVLIPCGTANAMYSSFFPPIPGQDDTSYRLKSLQAFIDNLHTTPLTLAISSLSSLPSSEPSQHQEAISVVVTSTALHANILHHSEALRKEMPGIERFKVAAQNNITKWYNSYVKLLPVPSVGVVQIYDPAKKKFVPHDESNPNDPIVNVDGPFVYFLSTVNVDRLEKYFCITSLHSAIPPETAASFDIVMVRPLRDLSLDGDSSEARLVFAKKAIAILQGAYENGSHVKMRYATNGEIESDGDGPPVVEYIRCGGWEWIPVDTDEAAHLLCADGAIFNIKKGGRACTTVMPYANERFHVYI